MPRAIIYRWPDAATRPRRDTCCEDVAITRGRFGRSIGLITHPRPPTVYQPPYSVGRLGSFFPSQHLHHLRYTPAYDCKHGLGLTRQIMSLSFNPLQALHATYLLSLESLASHPTTLLELMAGFGTSFAPQIAPPPCFLASSRIRIQRSR